MSDQQHEQPEQETESRPATEHTPSTAASTPQTQEAGPPADADFTDPPVLEATGDEVVDAALEQFDRVTGEPLATHIEAAEKVQDTLQSRLSDLGDS